MVWALRQSSSMEDRCGEKKGVGCDEGKVRQDMEIFYSVSRPGLFDAQGSIRTSKLTTHSPAGVAARE